MVLGGGFRLPWRGKRGWGGRGTGGRGDEGIGNRRGIGRSLVGLTLGFC